MKAHLLKIFLFCLSFAFIACNPKEPTKTALETVQPYTKRLLIEDYTGIWCGNCPKVAHAIDILLQESDKVIPVGIHRQQSTNPSARAYDPFNFNSSAVEAKYGFYGYYPTGMLDRATKWSNPARNTEQARKLLAEPAGIGLTISPRVSNGTLTIPVNIKFGADYSSKRLRLIVYVLEKGLVEDQVNYTDFYGGTHIVENYEYNHVLRASVTSIMGDDIPWQQTTLNNIYTQVLNIPISETHVNELTNMYIVAFVISSSGNALNVRSAEIGETQEFQEIEI